MKAIHHKPRAMQRSKVEPAKVSFVGGEALREWEKIRDDRFGVKGMEVRVMFVASGAIRLSVQCKIG